MRRLALIAFKDMDMCHRSYFTCPHSLGACKRIKIGMTYVCTYTRICFSVHFAQQNTKVFHGRLGELAHQSLARVIITANFQTSDVRTLVEKRHVSKAPLRRP